MQLLRIQSALAASLRRILTLNAQRLEPLFSTSRLCGFFRSIFSLMISMRPGTNESSNAFSGSLSLSARSIRSHSRKNLAGANGSGILAEPPTWRSSRRASAEPRTSSTMRSSYVRNPCSATSSRLRPRPRAMPSIPRRTSSRLSMKPNAQCSKSEATRASGAKTFQRFFETHSTNSNRSMEPSAALLACRVGSARSMSSRLVGKKRTSSSLLDGPRWARQLSVCRLPRMQLKTEHRFVFFLSKWAPMNALTVCFQQKRESIRMRRDRASSKTTTGSVLHAAPGAWLSCRFISMTHRRSRTCSCARNFAGSTTSIRSVLPLSTISS